MKKQCLILFMALLTFGSCSKKAVAPTTSATTEIKPTTTAANSNGSDAKAIEIMKGYIDAIGGREKLMNVKSMMTKMSASTGMGDITMTQYVKDGKFNMKVEMAGSTVSEQIFDGTTIQISGMGGTQKVTDAGMIKDAKKQARMFDELDQLLSDKVIKKFLITEDLDGKKVNKVTVINDDKSETTQYFEVGTNLLLRTVSAVDVMGTKSQQTMDFSNYQDVNGVKFPHSIKMSGGSVPFPLDLKVSAMMMNSDLPDALFKIN